MPRPSASKCAAGKRRRSISGNTSNMATRFLPMRSARSPVVPCSACRRRPLPGLRRLFGFPPPRQRQFQQHARSGRRRRPCPEHLVGPAGPAGAGSNRGEEGRNHRLAARLPASRWRLHLAAETGVRRRGRCGLHLGGSARAATPGRRACRARRLRGISALAGQRRRRLRRPSRLAEQSPGDLLRAGGLGGAGSAGEVARAQAARRDCSITLARQPQSLLHPNRGARQRQPRRSRGPGPRAADSSVGRQERQARMDCPRAGDCRPAEGAREVLRRQRGIRHLGQRARPGHLQSHQRHHRARRRRFRRLPGEQGSGLVAGIPRAPARSPAKGGRAAHLAVRRERGTGAALISTTRSRAAATRPSARSISATRTSPTASPSCSAIAARFPLSPCRMRTATSRGGLPT